MSGRASIAIFVPHIGCPHRCSFCDQRAITGSHTIPHAVDVQRAVERAVECGVDAANTEIAFFGGSFTAIPREYMLELLSAAKPYVDAGFRGIRLSTRPDAINSEILELLKSFGVTSIELGAQSMSDSVLEINERGHTSDDVERAAKLVKQYGFTLGLQMMVGLYGSTPELDLLTAKRVIALKPHEARIYPTVILKNTRLGELYLHGEYQPYRLNDAVALCAELLEMFESAGISVIKLGLHSSSDVENDMLGGLYHPAFRELCESEIYRKRMEELIGNDKAVTFTVPQRQLSKALGQKKSNIDRFRSMGVEVKIIPNPKQSEYLIKIPNGGQPDVP